jgi:Asp/Glu/hydantoin racemase
MARILLINPNTSERTTEMMLAVARPLLPPDMTLRGLGAASGVAMIVDEAGLAAGAAEVVRIGTAEALHSDAVIVAAFGDPGAGTLQAMLPIPVIGIGEAAIRDAAANGRRFGIATTTPLLVRSIETCVRRLGLGGMFTGVRVPGGDPLALAADPAAQEDALAAAATACIEEDGADSVIIGGGPLSATAARLRHRFGIAIVEPVPAAMREVLGRLVEPIISLSTT